MPAQAAFPELDEVFPVGHCQTGVGTHSGSGDCSDFRHRLRARQAGRARSEERLSHAQQCRRHHQGQHRRGHRRQDHRRVP